MAGVGGTGVITIGQLLGMPAHLEGKGVVTQDSAGLAQKGGATWSHVQIAERPEDIHTTKVDTAKADLVVEETYRFGRHTGVTLEGRAILADYNAGEHSLTVYQATQAPHMMQDIFSRHLNIPEANVRVICKDPRHKQRQG